MKFGVLIFPGSNCDHDAFWTIQQVAKQPVTFLWHDSHDLENCDSIIVPGGGFAQKMVEVDIPRLFKAGCPSDQTVRTRGRGGYPGTAKRVLDDRAGTPGDVADVRQCDRGITGGEIGFHARRVRHRPAGVPDNRVPVQLAHRQSVRVVRVESRTGAGSGLGRRAGEEAKRCRRDNAAARRRWLERWLPDTIRSSAAA